MRTINQITPLKATKINFINENIEQKVVDNNFFVQIDINKIENNIHTA